MTEQQPKTVESVTPSDPTPAPVEAPKDVVPPHKPVYEEAPKDVVAEEKSVIPFSPSDTDFDEIQEVADEKLFDSSVNQDMALARVATEKRLSLIKAWEESEKSKAENKAHKKHIAIDAWENSKKAAVEAELRMIEEQLEKKRAEYAEEIKNRIAKFHKEAEENRAIVEAKKGEELLKAEEIATKHRASGTIPKKLLGYFKCFSIQV
ncbi:PREDICTED: remorin-like isoform X2 [Lupinus angustifolius]|uniref:remorin-like isoform X2 n=1 Tax=Lupinus angustifolius TaxID=3871 RepID=UPI00092FB86A|nr:PREDICTED: remorin-like isoform X2 [Lupinus angustifolius]